MRKAFRKKLAKLEEKYPRDTPREISQHLVNAIKNGYRAPKPTGCPEELWTHVRRAASAPLRPVRLKAPDPIVLGAAAGGPTVVRAAQRPTGKLCGAQAGTRHSGIQAGSGVPLRARHRLRQYRASRGRPKSVQEGQANTNLSQRRALTARHSSAAGGKRLPPPPRKGALPCRVPGPKSKRSQSTNSWSMWTSCSVTPPTSTEPEKAPRAWPGCGPWRAHWKRKGCQPTTATK